MSSRSQTVVPVLIACACGLLCGAAPPAGMEFTKLDDLEDATPWLKGDPKTDLEQRDAAVSGSTEFVKEGKGSLAFMIRVNWTKRPAEKYAKGWPMMTRRLEPIRDWTGYDYLYFWLHAKTDCGLMQPRVLRVGFLTGDAKSTRTWYTIPCIQPNKWLEVAVPLTLDVDWQRISGVTFYVAEAWYRDGDKVDFYIDDMRLAARTAPAIASCAASSRVFPRGRSVAVDLKVEGPIAGAAVRCQVTDLAGATQVALSEKLTAKQQSFVIPTPNLPVGGHYATLELLDAEGQVLDSRRSYFRRLQPGRRSYLKLITFYTKPLLKSEPETLSVLNGSAYAGVAIPLLGSYDTDPIPEYAAFEAQAKLVRAALRIDPWPWVVLNRMIAAPPDGSGHAAKHAQNLKYFQSIKGLDLDNETGARADTLKLWRYAVRLARQWQSPGIMFDPEAYNWYRAYHAALVAAERGETAEAVIAKCEKLGADFARIIAEEYPACVVWSLFSRMEKSHRVGGREDPVYTTTTYITLGMLKYAKQNNVPLKFLCGGETTPGYCNKDVDAMKRKIVARDSDVAHFLEEFPDHLFLAGTISPFHDYSIVKSFIEKGYKDSPIRSIQDFEPMFKALFDAYDWLWIYASSAAQTLPYNPDRSSMYGKVLRAALDASVAGK